MGITTEREARGRVAGDGISMAWGYWPGQGRPVVALHGITASYVNFVGIADRLAGRRPLLALDLRGRGDSDKAGPYGFAQHAADVAAAMGQFGLGPALVVGHSMGAFVAAALAADRPELVSGVVLIDGGMPLESPAGIDPERLLDVALAAQMARLRSTYRSLDEYFDYWRGLPAFDGQWNPWVERYLTYDLGGTAPELRPKAAEDAVRADFAETLDTALLRSRVGAVKVPALLLRATAGFEPGHPPLFPDALVAREGAAMADLTDRVVAGTTHYTIALGSPGATVVADSIVEWADRARA